MYSDDFHRCPGFWLTSEGSDVHPAGLMLLKNSSSTDLWRRFEDVAVGVLSLHLIAMCFWSNVELLVFHYPREFVEVRLLP